LAPTSTNTPSRRLPKIIENPFLDATRIGCLAVLLFDGSAFTAIRSANGEHRASDLSGQPETANGASG
jgi:hypothetical protein